MLSNLPAYLALIGAIAFVLACLLARLDYRRPTFMLHQILRGVFEGCVVGLLLLGLGKLSFLSLWLG
jgi:hypothetical protein